jgi:hypothetical protein
MNRTEYRKWQFRQWVKKQDPAILDKIDVPAIQERFKERRPIDVRRLKITIFGKTTLISNRPYNWS